MVWQKKHFHIKRVLGNGNGDALGLFVSKLLRVATDLKCARNRRWTGGHDVYFLEFISAQLQPSAAF